MPHPRRLSQGLSPLIVIRSISLRHTSRFLLDVLLTHKSNIVFLVIIQDRPFVRDLCILVCLVSSVTCFNIISSSLQDRLSTFWKPSGCNIGNTQFRLGGRFRLRNPRCSIKGNHFSSSPCGSCPISMTVNSFAGHRVTKPISNTLIYMHVF